MNAQFKKGILELCVLAKIYEKDMYGYEIVQVLEEYMEVNEGSIYPILRRLTKDGVLTSYIIESKEGPARKYYKITSFGKEQFSDLMKQWRKFESTVNFLLSEVNFNEQE